MASVTIPHSFHLRLFFPSVLFTLLTTTITATTPPPQQPQQLHDQRIQQEMMRLMLEDAMSQLSTMGFTILSQGINQNKAKLVALNNITFFAVDDDTIESGSLGYVDRVLLHTVPNHFLPMVDLERLPVGTMLPTLERRQSLEVTSGRINGVRVKDPNLIVLNYYIVVHSVCLPFPRTHPTAPFVYHAVVEGPYAAHDELGGCDVYP